MLEYSETRCETKPTGTSECGDMEGLESVQLIENKNTCELYTRVESKFNEVRDRIREPFGRGHR